MQYIADVLAGPSLADARSWVMAHQIRTRVIDRCLRLVFKEEADLKIKHMALGRDRAN